MSKSESEKMDEEAKEIASVLREMLSELKDISTSLKSIARSQANQTSVQKSLSTRGAPGTDHR
jgi:DNA-binding transcriptional regulator GbsR (MarR family)